MGGIDGITTFVQPSHATLYERLDLLTTFLQCT